MFDTVQPDAADIEALEADDTPTGTETPDGVENPSESLSEPVAHPSEDDAESFPRDYVLKLRKESQGYRQRAKDAEQSAADAEAYAEGFARRLHTALVAATGKLADPTDLPYSVEHLMDDDAIGAAVDELLTEKPHLKARRVSGDVGQGERGPSAGFSLLDALRSRA